MVIRVPLWADQGRKVPKGTERSRTLVDKNRSVFCVVSGVTTTTLRRPAAESQGKMSHPDTGQWCSLVVVSVRTVNRFRCFGRNGRERNRGWSVSPTLPDLLSWFSSFPRTQGLKGVPPFGRHLVLVGVM